ncbi:C39 family peptidase [Microlunatus soli]|uniref:Peptidase_C39 like family protein n=1 Tax=Microlunatus soli TaxID=630515 RepID=A0A1H2A645_9ACTN|nr:C39 family peptidase [Microlunatus soli]SDT41252.1 Peptidase_C39 like family protein [Microlunatus soli]
MRIAAASAVTGACVLALLAAASPAQAEPRTPLDRPAERSRIIGTPTLSADELAGIAAKDSRARRQVSQRAVSSSGLVDSMRWVQQANSYYCGPATLVTMLKGIRVSRTQAQAASMLGTTRNGTDWYNGTSYPMPAAINSVAPAGVRYYAQGLNTSPTSGEKSTFKTRLVTDVNDGYGIAGNAWEIANGPHLVGHPADRQIFHWIPIRGYSNSGGNTHYVDPASGAASISWSGGVPKSSAITTDKMVTILGGRGYVW